VKRRVKWVEGGLTSKGGEGEESVEWAVECRVKKVYTLRGTLSPPI
jgi:hypothetical protein